MIVGHSVCLCGCGSARGHFTFVEGVLFRGRCHGLALLVMRIGLVESGFTQTLRDNHLQGQFFALFQVLAEPLATEMYWHRLSTYL